MEKRRLGQHIPKRTALITLLLQQQGMLSLDRIEPDLLGYGGCFSYLLTFAGKHHRALLLVRSSEYWTRRVHLALQHRHTSLDMLVTWEHDSCVPCSVLALKTGIMHSAYATPAPITGRNRYTAPLIVGQLLCGVQSAYDMLETLPRSTQYRYLAQVAQLSKRARSRPLKA